MIFKTFHQSKGLKQMIKYGFEHNFFDLKCFEVLIVFILYPFISL